MRESTPTERIGLTAYRLTIGHGTTARQLAEDLGLTVQGARFMLEKLSLVLPLTVENGVWYMTERQQNTASSQPQDSLKPASILTKQRHG